MLHKDLQAHSCGLKEGGGGEFLGLHKIEKFLGLHKIEKWTCICPLFKTEGCQYRKDSTC